MDQKQLNETVNAPASAEQQALVSHFKIVVQTDQAEVEEAQRRVSLGQIAAPITGVAGFHQVDVGNFVHSGDQLVVINQLQPISATFNVQEDRISEVLAALKSGSNPKVELWNREDTARIATGRLVAIDNQIDATTGMVKARAQFENKDGALFPNEFVNVHLFLNPR
jgi:membrane fusion protein, multidrug efflux system